MAQNIKISASILSSNFNNLADEIKKCEDAGVDMIHIDVMDGMFVPNITIGQVIVEHVRRITKLPLDVHLMIEKPGRYVESFADAGADIIGIHAECYGPRKSGCEREDQWPKEIESFNPEAARSDIKKIATKGKKAYLVVNPSTPMQFEDLYDDLDGFLIMSVNPGFSGQKFMLEALPKIEQLSREFNGEISVDGGVNKETAPKAVESGVTTLATASYFFGAEDPVAAVQYLKSLSV